MAVDLPDKGSPHDRARVVRRYLSALDARKPGRTTARTAETVTQRIHQIDILLMSADPVQRLHLTQERIDLHAEQLRLGTAHGDFGELEKAFARVARSYGDRHDITFSAWRQVGVDADVLARAGINPSAKPGRPQNAPAAPPTETPAKAAAPKSPVAPPTDASVAKTPEPTKAASAKQPTTTAPPSKPAAPAKSAAPAKKVPAAKKPADAANGGAATRPAKKAAAKAEDTKPEQQQLPAEAHLLS